MSTDLAYFEQDRLWGQRPEPYQVQVVADILSLIPEDVRTVLDAGCGDGLVTNALPERLSVLGVDTSEEALRHVRRRHSLASVTQLPFENRAFDLVMCNDVVEHLEDREFSQALSELARVAARYVLLTVPNGEQLAASFARCADCRWEYHVNHHHHSFDRGRLSSCLGDAFRPIEIRYSGDVTRPPWDATLALRHAQGHYRTWQQGLCPRCGSSAQVTAEEDMLLRAIESLRTEGWADRLTRSGLHDNRSELMILFARSAASRGPYPMPPTAPGSLLAIDFTNPLQAAFPDITPGSSWAQYGLSDDLQRSPQGVRRSPHAPSLATVRGWFPVEARPGDRLVAEFSGSGSLSLVSADGVTAIRETLASAAAAAQPERLSIPIASPWSPGRFGLAIEVLLSDEVVLHSLCYERADTKPYDRPMVLLPAGHSVVPLGSENGIAVTWGLEVAEPGRMPLPSLPGDEPGEPQHRPEELLAIMNRAYVRLDQHHWQCRKAEHESRRRAEELAESKLQRRAEELADLRRQLELKSGIRGGAKESLRSIRKRLWPPLNLPGEEEFSEPWRRLDPLPAATGGRRVLVLSHMFPRPAQPGSGSFVLEQVKALRTQAGIDARVIVGIPVWLNAKRQPWQLWARNRLYWRHVAQAAWYELAGVPVLYVPYRAVLGFWNHGRMYRAAMAGVIEEVRANFAFDCVHAHTSYLDGSAGRWIAHRYGVPLLITEHTGPFSKLTRDRMIRQWTVRALRAAEQVIAVSEAQRRDMLSYMADRQDRLIVLPNGVDTSLFRPSYDRQVDPLRPRILFVGYFCEVKGLPLLLTAFARLCQRIPAARLTLVGRGERPQDESEVKRLVQELGIAESVELPGFQSRESVARIMREESDFLVLSSRSESFGCVVTEAMASGLPVVSTRCGGPEDVVTAPLLGQLCDQDPESLAQAMFEVASRLPAFDARQIRRHVEENFSYASLAERLAVLYGRS